ncbi:hypothetical protein H6G33_10155 [Calothrix sp. FACHB-1219]|uniref:hypothetical protein n=1 Tax=unclassified Calothrix TaxID=2619626 RepID=UPI00168796ED|nr:MULTISPECIES: hypothetical protein [unclassified Calothrix]MBD2201710.1 hypothetical protein [Calothrix sp. FACHB-168]MBD2217396.1 hypothetical protein [Calothrix sp. FACHB-1219]
MEELIFPVINSQEIRKRINKLGFVLTEGISVRKIYYSLENKKIVLANYYGHHTYILLSYDENLDKRKEVIYLESFEDGKKFLEALGCESRGEVVIENRDIYEHPSYINIENLYLDNVKDAGWFLVIYGNLYSNKLEDYFHLDLVKDLLVSNGDSALTSYKQFMKRDGRE